MVTNVPPKPQHARTDKTFTGRARFTAVSPDKMDRHNGAGKSATPDLDGALKDYVNTQL